MTGYTRAMRYVPLGSTGVKVSELCFGTMSFGGIADEETSAAMFAACRDAGVNHFDCADVYVKGRSEEILGRLLDGCRDDVVLATKAYFPTGDGPNDRGASRYHLVRAVEASLRRLGTDRIDVYYIHRFDDQTPLEETLCALDDLVTAGKILYPAASNFAAWQVAKAIGISHTEGLVPFACIQPMYNLVKRQAEVELLPMAACAGLGVFPYSPLGGGLLSGKYGVSRRPASGRIVENEMYKVRYGAERNFEIAEAFTALANEVGTHPVSLAIAWVGAHPAVTAPIVGARDVDQLRPALAAADVSLSDELYERLSALSPTPPPATDRTEETRGIRYGAR